MPRTAQAQVCAGYPTGDRGMYFGGRADFPENADSYGVEANYNFSGPLGVYGGLNVISGEDTGATGDDDDSVDELYAGVAFEAANLGLMIGPRVSACLVGEIRNMSEDGVYLQRDPGRAGDRGQPGRAGRGGLRLRAAAGGIQPHLTWTTSVTSRTPASV